VVGISRDNTVVSDESTPLTPVSEADPDLRVLLEQVQEFLGIERPTTPHIPIIAPTSSMVPIPVPVPSPASVHQVPPRESRNGGGTVGHVRRTKFQRIREKFRLLLAKFSRTDRGPITLSDGLVPEREENAEVVEKRFGKLFG